MSPFEYRALDLLADYEPRFAYFPAIWRTHIQSSENPDLHRTFGDFLYAMTTDASCDLDLTLTDQEFSEKLGGLTDRDRVQFKILQDLGLWNPITRNVLAYFVSRRNLLDDERCWERIVEMINEELEIRQC